MRARALKSFRMGQATVRVGEVFSAEKSYLEALVRNGLVVMLPPEIGAGPQDCAPEAKTPEEKPAKGKKAK